MEWIWVRKYYSFFFFFLANKQSRKKKKVLHLQLTFAHFLNRDCREKVSLFLCTKHAFTVAWAAKGFLTPLWQDMALVPSPHCCVHAGSECCMGWFYWLTVLVPSPLVPSTGGGARPIGPQPTPSVSTRPAWIDYSRESMVCLTKVILFFSLCILLCKTNCK